VGGFSAFATGFLSGKTIVSGNPVTNTDSSTRPGRSVISRKSGFTNSNGIPILVEVVTGYYVTVMTQNGQVVAVDVRPVYGTFLAGFKSVSNPYRSPNGGELLK